MKNYSWVAKLPVANLVGWASSPDPYIINWSTLTREGLNRAIIKRIINKDWILNYVLAEVAAVHSLDLSTHVGGAEALRTASQDHQDHMDVRLPKREVDEMDVIDEVEGFITVIAETTPEAQEWRRRFEEGLTLEECEIMDNYIRLAREEEKSSAQAKFQELKDSKWLAWALVNEHTDWNMHPWEMFGHKIDRDLAHIEAMGKTLNPQALQANLKHLHAIQNQCVRYSKDKSTGELKVDYNGYQGSTRTSKRNEEGLEFLNCAMRVTQEYREFWGTDEGEALSSLKGAKQEAWAQVAEAGLVGTFGIYHRQLHEVFTPWWCNKEPDEKLDNPLLIDSDRGLSYEDYTVKESLYAQIEGRNTEGDYEAMCTAKQTEPTDITGVRVQHCAYRQSGLGEARLGDEMNSDEYWASYDDPNAVRGHESNHEGSMDKEPVERYQQMCE